MKTNDDLISRTDAIEAVTCGALSSATIFGRSDAGMVALRETVRVIKELPSAQPNLDEWCTDCKEYNHETHSCPRWNRVIHETVDEVIANNQPKQGEWIPCEERLPRADEHDSELGVLVTLGNGYSGLEFDTYHEATEYDEAHWYDWDGYVVAWMPLPQPYSGARMK